MEAELLNKIKSMVQNVGSGSLNEAVSILEVFLDISGISWCLYYSLAIVYSENDQHEKAIECYEKCIDLNEDCPGEVYENLYAEYILLQKYEEAFLLFPGWLKKDPLNENLYRSYSKLFQLIGNLECAIKSLKVCISINPKDPYYYFQLAELQFEMKSFEEAIKYYNKYIELNPDNIQKFEQLLFKIQIDGEDNSQIPNNSVCYYKIGLAYENNLNLDEAVKNYKKSIELDDKINKSFIGLIRIYVSCGRIEEADKIYDIVNSLPDLDNNFLKELGLCKITLNGQKVKSLTNQDNSFLKELGICYRTLGDYSKSIVFYEKYLQIEQNEEQKIELAIVYMLNKMTEKAIQICSEVCQSNPNPKFLEYLYTFQMYKKYEQVDLKDDNKAIQLLDDIKFDNTFDQVYNLLKTDDILMKELQKIDSFCDFLLRLEIVNKDNEKI